MALCENGHLYDASIYSSCPYCNPSNRSIDFDTDGSDEISPTVPAGSQEFSGSVLRFEGQDEIDVTHPPMDYKGSSTQDSVEATHPVFEEKMSFDPVVGWLVCIEGFDKGHDYRVRAKTNSIGRSELMDICIKGDSTISANKHAKLDYDIKNNAFYLLTAESTNTIYLNDAPVYTATQLHAYDYIQFGTSKFMFVPFCNDKFKWSSDDSKDK